MSSDLSQPDESLGATQEQVEQRDDGIVFTRGVSSVVLDGDSVVGHVMLLDCDDCDRLAVERCAAAIDGLAAVFESSPGSYHLWDLTLRDDLAGAIMDGLSFRICDDTHIAQSRRRGSYVLRAAPKVHGDGSVYKAPPRLLSVDASGLDDETPVSRPHVDLLRDMAQASDLGDAALRAIDSATVLRGSVDGLAVHSYMTLTDATKAEVRGDRCD